MHSLHHLNRIRILFFPMKRKDLASSISNMIKKNVVLHFFSKLYRVITLHYPYRRQTIDDKRRERRESEGRGKEHLSMRCTWKRYCIYRCRYICKNLFHLSRVISAIFGGRLYKAQKRRVKSLPRGVNKVCIWELPPSYPPKTSLWTMRRRDKLLKALNNNTRKKKVTFWRAKLRK